MVALINATSNKNKPPDRVSGGFFSLVRVFITDLI